MIVWADLVLSVTRAEKKRICSQSGTQPVIPLKVKPLGLKPYFGQTLLKMGRKTFHRHEKLADKFSNKFRVIFLILVEFKLS